VISDDDIKKILKGEGGAQSTDVHIESYAAGSSLLITPQKIGSSVHTNYEHSPGLQHKLC
jgi:hypothetical protein